MAWAIHPEWAQGDAVRIKRDLSKVVHAIARFEPVRLLAPPGRAFREARQHFSRCPAVTIIKAPVDDFWMRDIMPTFAIRSESVRKRIVAIDWNFNGWGGTPDRPARPGDQLAKIAAATFGVPRISSSFVAEGGAFAVDGRGTLITTRSCLLNSNRNPVRGGVNRQRAIACWLRKVGIRKVIWLEGDACEPITSGHIDGYVLWTPGNSVLVEDPNDSGNEPIFWREHDLELLVQSRNAQGRKLSVVRVLSPRRRYLNRNRDSFAASYLNVYIANGAVVAPQFGDPERDALAREALASAFPQREIIPLRIDAIAAGGGGVHCITQSMPMLERKRDARQATVNF
ncbi:agmatine deiminase family protein [Bradyrhizobium manausense]|nr:agmatine deiminase family protein [Bradyrhizobium manausense]